MSVNLEEAVLVKGGKIFTGRAGQTKASDITFDPTGTDLVSTTAESAIKEVNGKKANESLIATVQTSLTASRAYSAGEQFVYNELLYKFTTSCAQGGTITIGGNCELADKVTTQIYNIPKISRIKFTGTTDNDGIIKNINSYIPDGNIILGITFGDGSWYHARLYSGGGLRRTQIIVTNYMTNTPIANTSVVLLVAYISIPGYL